tara:strand:+ start:280 stop:543 length:264 start_codon:yes stop_codon:yes gene_type:complete
VKPKAKEVKKSAPKTKQIKSQKLGKKKGANKTVNSDQKSSENKNSNASTAGSVRSRGKRSAEKAVSLNKNSKKISKPKALSAKPEMK